jgi:hypothetical protein
MDGERRRLDEWREAAAIREKEERGEISYSIRCEPKMEPLFDFSPWMYFCHMSYIY